MSLYSRLLSDIISRQQKPWLDCAGVQTNLGLHYLHMPQGQLFPRIALYVFVKVKITWTNVTLHYFYQYQLLLLLNETLVFVKIAILPTFLSWSFLISGITVLSKEEKKQQQKKQLKQIKIKYGLKVQIIITWGQENVIQPGSRCSKCC